MGKCVACDKEAFMDGTELCLSCAVNVDAVIGEVGEDKREELKAKAQKVIQFLESLAKELETVRAYDSDNLWDCRNCGREYQFRHPSGMCSQCQMEHYG